MTAGAPVAVVGGGVIGLCAAYSLRRQGLDVILLEEAAAGSGASHGNAGWIVPSMSAPLPAPGMLRMATSALARRNGPLRMPPGSLPAMLPWLFRFWTHCSAVEHVAALRATAALAADTMEMYDQLADDGVPFEMSTAGLLNVFSNSANAERGRASLRPLAGLGYPEPGLLDRERLRELEPALGPAAAAGFLVGQERAVEPASLAAGLVARLREMDVPVLEHRAVSGFEITHGRVSAVVGPKGRRPVAAVVIAAGARSPALLRKLGVRLHMQPGKGYSMSVHRPGLPTRPVLLAEAKVAVTPFRDRTRIAGLMEFAGYDPRPHQRRLAALAAAAQPYLTTWSESDQSDAWCGWRPVTPDGLPVIGRLPAVANAYVATGHAMLGVTLAPATGRAVAALVLDQVVPAHLQPFRLDRPGLARWRDDRRGASPSLVSAGGGS